MAPQKYALFHRLKTILNAVETNSTTRTVSTSCLVQAGFQGFQGINLNNEQRQNMIDKKKRMIKKLENMPRELKPIKDFYIRHSWQLPERQRDVLPPTAEELERRILLQKEWSRYLAECKRADEAKILRLRQSQEKALYELHQESEELYLAALELDETLFPFTQKGPTETPPVEGYKPPLGGTVHWEESFD